MNPAFRFFPDQASTIAPRVDALYFYLVGISVFFSLLIFISVVYFAVKYRRRSEDDPPPPQMRDDVRLEVTWIVVPLFLVMIAFFWGASVYFAMARPPANALEIFVVGRQWMWKFQHPDGQREINELHVPLGRPVKLTLASEDVIHSFFIPAFRIKHDVVPGYYTMVWFEATKTGRFHLFCAEYCGTQHAGMMGQVVVLEPNQYEAWLSGELGGPSAPGAAEGSVAGRGQRLFQDLGCRNLPPARSPRHRADAGRLVRQNAKTAERPKRCRQRQLSARVDRQSPGQDRRRIPARDAAIPGQGQRRAIDGSDRLHQVHGANGRTGRRCRQTERVFRAGDGGGCETAKALKRPRDFHERSQAGIEL